MGVPGTPKSFSLLVFYIVNQPFWKPPHCWTPHADIRTSPSYGAGPCLHVFSGTSKFEIVHRDNQHAGWWLYTHPSEKYESVNWDDDYSQYFRENKIDGNQTTNQTCTCTRHDKKILCQSCSAAQGSTNAFSRPLIRVITVLVAKILIGLPSYSQCSQTNSLRIIHHSHSFPIKISWIPIKSPHWSMKPIRDHHVLWSTHRFLQGDSHHSELEWFFLLVLLHGDEPKPIIAIIYHRGIHLLNIHEPVPSGYLPRFWLKATWSLHEITTHSPWNSPPHPLIH